MRLPSRSLIAAAFVLIAQASLGAQTRSTWSVQGSGLYSGLGGDAYAGLDPGMGFEAQLRRRLSPLWSVGCGFQVTNHSFTDFEGDMRLQGAFCEPRRLIDVASDRVFPYVSARGAVLQQKVSDPNGFSGSANGLTGNVGAGLMFPFGSASSSAPTVLEIGASAGYTWFGDFTANAPGHDPFLLSTGNGYNFVLRVGLAVGIGK